MRVVSQKGYIDIPYEQTAVTVGWSGDKGKYFIYGNGMFRNTHTELAEYSTEEKALKAMKMLHQCYVGTVILNNVDVSEDFYEQLQKLFSNGEPAIISVCTDGKKSSVEQFNSVFQFPADDEIEV